MPEGSRTWRAVFNHGLTRIDPEVAHRGAFAAIRAAKPVLRLLRQRSRPVQAMGITFPAPLGLAAGFDKNAVGIDALAGLGFGFIEIGTVTGEPQSGNPKPRLHRLPADAAIVNRMGFNNDGAEAVAARLQKWRTARRTGDRPVLGVNIGKTKVVPEAEAAADYRKSATLLAPHADYLVVNVSSPNTPGLRDLQSVEKLAPILHTVREVTEVPLLVKIAPDLADADVLAVAELATDARLAGIVATNTTIARTGLVSDPAEIAAAGAGGLSGAPLRERALEVLRLLRANTDLTIIGVGGIGNLADARERLDAGADLLQAYTGFIYGGPTWARSINRGLAQ